MAMQALEGGGDTAPRQMAGHSHHPAALPPGKRPGRLRLECDGTRAEIRFRLSAKRTSQFKSAGGRQFSRPLAAEECASAVEMLDTPCSEVV